MDEVWMLDYLHAIFPAWGVFTSEEEANKWVKEHNSPDIWGNFKTFRVAVNFDCSREVPNTCPEHSYRNQR